MKTILIALLGLLAPCIGCAQLSGTTKLSGTTYLNVPVTTPTITNVQETSSASTIAVKFTTSSFATPGFACGTTAGTYTLTAKDNGIDVRSPVNHVQIVAGLTSSTTYFCQYTATNTAGSATGTFSIATTAAAATTAITSVTFSTPVDVESVGGCTGVADTYYNAVSNDGNDYFLNMDTQGWACNGQPASQSANLSVGVWKSLSPVEGYTINFLTGYGVAGAETTFESRSAKASGMFSMAGGLFIWANGQQNSCCGLPSTSSAYPESGGNIIASFDHGKSWNNDQTIGYFQPNGKPTTAAMFAGGGPTNGMGSCTFIEYGTDDGSLGYFNAANQYDGGDAYVYSICNDGYWNNGNKYYLARVLRARLPKLQASDYQWWVSGDGSLDGAWSSTEASATAILTNTGELSFAAVQHIPGRGYLLFTFYYPQGLSQTSGDGNNSTWLTYYMPHPWSAPTLINTTNWPTQGYYNAIPVQGTVTGGNSFTVIFTSSFWNGGTYRPYTATATFN